MLSKHQKLQLRQEKEFFTEATRTVIHPFLVYIQHNQEVPRFTVIVPKRVVTQSTQRNKLKRQIYQVIQDRLKENAFAAVSVAFVVNRPASQEQLQQVTNQVLDELTI